MLDFLLKWNLVPGFMMKLIINQQIKSRLKSESKLYHKTQGNNKKQLIEALRESSVALSTDTANQQHYEVPTQFYKYILGPHLKYSSCYFDGDEDLAEAEGKMLELYCQRAELEDGQDVLELGCGWGSLSLYLAKKYPNSNITAVSNSATQKQYIDRIALKKKYDNLNVITCDINQLQLFQKFDRVISIEMFEHMRNYQTLMTKISNWLKPGGKLFIHYFCHKEFIYPFESTNSWMAKYFFQDGLMPSEDTLLHFQDDLKVENMWRVNGIHYSKTSYKWLENLSKNKQQVIQLFAKAYDDNPVVRYHYWCLFIRACAQLFAYNKGNEWFVVHYLFSKH